MTIWKSAAVQDAAEALIALGWSVVPPTRPREKWRIGDELLTTTELLVFASFVVIFPHVVRRGGDGR